jgi:hypothetical protein
VNVVRAEESVTLWFCLYTVMMVRYRDLYFDALHYTRLVTVIKLKIVEKRFVQSRLVKRGLVRCALLSNNEVWMIGELSLCPSFSHLVPKIVQTTRWNHPVPPLTADSYGSHIAVGHHRSI